MGRFAMTGAAGFVAPRHMKAIKAVGGDLVAALDPHDAVGVLDSYFTHCRFFTQPELFDRHLERRRNRGFDLNFMSVASPNWLHDAHIRMGMRLGANVICEKPLVINPRNLSELQVDEDRYGRRVFCILQLRLHPAVVALKRTLEGLPPVNDRVRQVTLKYVTRRGRWYDWSWKGDEAKSGGLAMNLGVHFFDLLLWLFGPCSRQWSNTSNHRRMNGTLELERADVKWFLSVDEEDLPKGHEGHAYRFLEIDGRPVDFSVGFEDLHTLSYQEILAGRGFGIDDVRPAVELVQRIRQGAA